MRTFYYQKLLEVGLRRSSPLTVGVPARPTGKIFFGAAALRMPIQMEIPAFSRRADLQDLAQKLFDRQETAPLSAFEVAQAVGAFDGSVEEWLASLAAPALAIRGVLNSSTQLPGTGRRGDAFLIGSNLWVWGVNSFVDAGPVRGVDGRSAYEVAVQEGPFVGSVEEWLESLKGEPGVDGGQSWAYFVTNWSEPPRWLADVSGGQVFEYELDGVVRYRFVPNAYDPKDDAFYTAFNSPVLSGLIVRRG